jgi:hypothetical protein
MTQDEMEDLTRLLSCWLSRPTALSRDVRNGKNGLIRLRDLIAKMTSEITELSTLDEQVALARKLKTRLAADNTKLENSLREVKDKLALQAELDDAREQLVQAISLQQELQDSLGRMSTDQPQIVIQEVEKQVFVEKAGKDPRVPLLEKQIEGMRHELMQAQKEREALEMRCQFLEQEVLNIAGAAYGES